MKVSEEKLMEAYDTLNRIVMFGVDVTPALSKQSDVEALLHEFKNLQSDVTPQQFYAIAGTMDGLLELDEEETEKYVVAVRKAAAEFKKSVNALYKHIQSVKPIDFDGIVDGVKSDYPAPTGN